MNDKSRMSTVALSLAALALAGAPSAVSSAPVAEVAAATCTVMDVGEGPICLPEVEKCEEGVPSCPLEECAETSHVCAALEPCGTTAVRECADADPECDTVAVPILCNADPWCTPALRCVRDCSLGTHCLEVQEDLVFQTIEFDFLWEMEAFVAAVNTGGETADGVNQTVQSNVHELDERVASYLDTIGPLTCVHALDTCLVDGSLSHEYGQYEDPAFESACSGIVPQQRECLSPRTPGPGYVSGYGQLACRYNADCETSGTLHVALVRGTFSGNVYGEVWQSWDNWYAGMNLGCPNDDSTCYGGRSGQKVDRAYGTLTPVILDWDGEAFRTTHPGHGTQCSPVHWELVTDRQGHTENRPVLWECDPLGGFGAFVNLERPA